MFQSKIYLKATALPTQQTLRGTFCNFLLHHEVMMMMILVLWQFKSFNGNSVSIMGFIARKAKKYYLSDIVSMCETI